MLAVKGMSVGWGVVVAGGAVGVLEGVVGGVFVGVGVVVAVGWGGLVEVAMGWVGVNPAGCSAISVGMGVGVDGVCEQAANENIIMSR